MSHTATKDNYAIPAAEHSPLHFVIANIHLSGCCGGLHERCVCGLAYCPSRVEWRGESGNHAIHPHRLAPSYGEVATALRSAFEVIDSLNTPDDTAITAARAVLERVEGEQ